MKNNNIRTKWNNFINKYEKYLNKEELWYDNLEKIKLYIKEYNRKPSQTSKDIEIKKLGVWFNSQKKNYKNKNNNIKISWENFIKEFNLLKKKN